MSSSFYGMVRETCSLPPVVFLKWFLDRFWTWRCENDVSGRVVVTTFTFVGLTVVRSSYTNRRHSFQQVSLIVSASLEILCHLLVLNPQICFPSIRTGSFNLVKKIRRRRFRWLGHLLRAGDQRMTYQALQE